MDHPPSVRERLSPFDLIHSLEIEFRGSVPRLRIYNKTIIFRVLFEHHPQEVMKALQYLNEKELLATLATLGSQFLVLVKAEQELTTSLSVGVELFGRGRIIASYSLTFDRQTNEFRYFSTFTGQGEIGLKLGALHLYSQRTKGQPYFDTYLSLFSRSLDLQPDQLTPLLQIIHLNTATLRSELRYRRADRASTPSSPAVHRPYLFYLGAALLVFIAFARTYDWQLPFFDSYNTAFAVALTITAIGLAQIAFRRGNSLAALGIMLTLIGGLAGEYDWKLPLVTSYEYVFYPGLFVLVLGIAPALIGVPAMIVGLVLLVIHLDTAFTTGFATVPLINWLVSVFLVGFGAILIRRQQSVRERGILPKH